MLFFIDRVVSLAAFNPNAGISNMFGSHPDVLVLSKLTMPLQLQWQQLNFSLAAYKGDSLLYYHLA
jgi:hypothetical protein